MKKQALNLNLAPAALLLVLTALALGPFTAMADPSIVWIGNNYPHAINADGSVVVGNTGDGLYETFRWTPDAGVVRLGMSSVEVLGVGAGTPDVSDDGNHVSATIITADSTLVTQGIWTKGEGWDFAMPPQPADGVIMDGSLGSAWGLSGDGTTLTGFYWRDNSDGRGTAHPNSWSREEGMVLLGSPLRNCRGNDLNYDGSVVVGWSERQDGTWCPTVWENGGYTVLHDSGIWSAAEGVSNDGNTIWGRAYNDVSTQVEAALWLRTDTGWQEQTLGVLPGTFPGYGHASCRDMTTDGQTIVGYNKYEMGNDSGFVWTMDEGMVSANDFFEAEGFVLPDYFRIATLTGISHNGVVITGFGYDMSVYPYSYEGFVATRENVSSTPDQTHLAKGIRIEGNHPNPFNPSTNIALSLDKQQNVSLGVYDLAGRLVEELHQGVLNQGRHQFTWNGRDSRGMQAASGVYFAHVRDENGNVQSHRMTLIK